MIESLDKEAGRIGVTTLLQAREGARPPHLQEQYKFSPRPFTSPASSSLESHSHFS